MMAVVLALRAYLGVLNCQPQTTEQRIAAASRQQRQEALANLSERARSAVEQGRREQADGQAQREPSLPVSSGYGAVSEQTSRAKTVFVRDYVRKDGTLVESHYRSPPRRR